MSASETTDSSSVVHYGLPVLLLFWLDCANLRREQYPWQHEIFRFFGRLKTKSLTTFIKIFFFWTVIEPTEADAQQKRFQLCYHT